jgi:hypothetical protein
MAGCIPIVEEHEGIAKKYEGCPILFTKDYSEITPEYLVEQYTKMVHTTYDFSRLFIHFYPSHVQEQIKTCGNYWCNLLSKKTWYNDKQTVFIIQDRFHAGIYNWFIYMIAILVDIYIANQNHHLLFHTICQYDFQHESLTFLQPKYKFIFDITNNNYNTVHLEGVPLLEHDRVDNRYIHFIRNIILHPHTLRTHNQHLSSLQRYQKPFRRIYISRNKSHNLPWYKSTTKNRHILNEDQLFPILVDHFQFEFIHLEEYSLVEKIKIFQEAEVIVSCFGGSLFCSTFAHPETKIIEITHRFANMSYENHYKYICETLSIRFFRYQNVQTLDIYNNENIIPYVGRLYNIIVDNLDNFRNFISFVLSQ